MSKSVWRFAHGGDRAFFNDYNFSVVEFPYCDKYFCHSLQEASNLKNRLKEKKIINLGFDNIQFTTSINQRSINIFNKSDKPNKNTGKENVPVIAISTAGGAIKYTKPRK